MLTIEIKEQQLNTSDDFNAQIEDQNPATKFDEIPGDLSLDVTIPINDSNRAILDNPDRFEKMGSYDDRRFEKAALRHLGQIIHRGTLVIEETDVDYTGWIRGAIGNLSEAVAGTYINQTTLAGQKSFENKSDYDPVSDDYACPKIFNRHFWLDRGKKSKLTRSLTDLEGNEYTTDDEDTKLTWQFLENYNFFVNSPAVGIATGGTDKPAVVSPMLFLWRAVELILSDNFVFVKENILKSDASLKKLILYNNFSIGKQTFITEQIEIISYDYYQNFFINKAVSAIARVTWGADKFYYKNLIPKIKLEDLVLGLQNYLNVVFSFNDLGECRILDRQILLTAKAYNVNDYMVGEWSLGERKDVTLKLSMTHDEDDSAFGDNFEDLSDQRNNIKEAVSQLADLSELTPELDEIRRVEADGCYYQYHWYTETTTDSKGNEQSEDVLGWEKVSIGFQPYFYNDGDRDIEEINTCFSTIRQSDNGYPLVMQKGNCDAFKTQYAKFSPRLLFYEGDEVASFHSSNLSLDYSGEIGLAAKRWNYWFPFWANRLPAKATFKFPASVYYYIRNNKAILPLATRHGSFVIDKITAVAGNADTIECVLEVFKRESIAPYTEGSVPGSGGGETNTFTPLYIGLTEKGKPYLVDENGSVRIPPAWGALSTASYAKSVCIDFDPVNKLLFVGGINGDLYITDMSDPADLKMKSIRVFASGNVSAIRYLNGVILIGKDKSKQVYAQPYYEDITGYSDFQASEGELGSGYVAKDFLYSDGYYYSCSQAGEIHRTTDPSGNWSELMDVKADFRKMVATSNKLLVFGKDDNHGDDRAFYALKSNPVSWHEFDVEDTRAIYVSDAVAVGSDRAVIVTNKQYGALKLIEGNNTSSYIDPSLAFQIGGVAFNNNLVVGIQESNGATKLAVSRYEWSWRYINVPVFFTKLFSYGG